MEEEEDALPHEKIDDPSKLCLFGQVYAIVESSVIIRPVEPASLDLSNLIYTKEGLLVGKIVDIFGQVASPYYTVKNQAKLGLAVDDSVFFNCKSSSALSLDNIYSEPDAGHSDSSASDE